MTEPGDGVAQPGDITSSDQRLYRFERAGRWLLFGCIGLFILESAFDAHDSPGTLGQALLDWPNNFFAALAMACWPRESLSLASEASAPESRRS
jgi:hypothetical protein